MFSRRSDCRAPIPIKPRAPRGYRGPSRTDRCAPTRGFGVRYPSREGARMLLFSTPAARQASRFTSCADFEEPNNSLTCRNATSREARGCKSNDARQLAGTTSAPLPSPSHPASLRIAPECRTRVRHRSRALRNAGRNHGDALSTGSRHSRWPSRIRGISRISVPRSKIS